ncbi:MAG TPA: methyltransferase type 11 [Lentisphaeria bacterium]|nr:methyltransferase type 11 [Lentisphaeria bacterium]
MDLQTLKYYDSNAPGLANKYDRVNGGISDYFQQSFDKKGKILDIGCGSGRDLKILHEMDYAADGVDPCEEFVECCNKHKTGYGSIVVKDSLPELKEIADKSYDGVLCSAVLMHLPKEQLFDASFTIRRILRDKGRFLMSVPLADETIDSCSNRDSSGRLFNGITPENFQLMFERIGFSLISRWENKDTLGREHRRWAVMLFKLESDSGSRPIDTIESVLNKDRKVATYKLALFRALAELAMTNYSLAIWRRDGNVSLPIENIAEKWIEYYWPIFESEKFIPQIQAESEKGRPVAFRELLSKLIEASKLTGGLSGFASFAINSRNRELTKEVSLIYRRLLSKIKTTLVDGPIKHAGGIGEDSVFDYDNGYIVIPHGIWMELSLMGHWIQDATILRWGELTAKISKGCIKPSEVIDCLLTVPIPEREIYSAKSFYDGLKQKECVWSGRSISKEYEVDHAIPFSLWKNNDLWNLFPTSSTENRNKKDKLPENFVIKRSKGTIVEYWKLMRERYPVRFEYEAGKFSGISFRNNKNWENILFANFAEAIEITAIQRGVERWQPASFSANGADRTNSRKQTDAECDDMPKITIRFFPSLDVACGFFRHEGSFLPHENADFAESIDVDNPHGNIDPSRHFAVKASGNSMDGGNAPIKNGDMLLLEKNEGGSVSNQIFAVEYRDEFGGTSYVLKRVEKDTFGQYCLVSLNKDYKDRAIPVNPENMFPFARLIKNLGKQG